MVVANGYQYYTDYSGSNGLYTTGALSTSGSSYLVNNCNSRILISKNGSACTACPAGELEIVGRECGTRMCVSVGGGRHL
jgi:hypothetical protein